MTKGLRVPGERLRCPEWGGPVDAVHLPSSGVAQVLRHNADLVGQLHQGVHDELEEPDAKLNHDFREVPPA